MEITNAIAFIAILITILGWFIVTRFNKRLDYRLKTLESFIPIAQDIVKQKIDGDKLAHSQTMFLLYGYKDEIDKINTIVELSVSKNYSKIPKISTELMNLIRTRLRRELLLFGRISNK